MSPGDRDAACKQANWQSLPWETAAAVVQHAGGQALPCEVLRGWVQAQLDADKPSLDSGQAAQRWSELMLPSRGLAAQVRALHALRGWLQEALPPRWGPRVHAWSDQLAQALCERHEALATQTQQRHSRLLLAGQLFASIAHELRNPLAVVESSVFLLRRQLREDEDATRHLHKITRSVSRCHEIIHDVLDMVRDAPLRTQNLGALEIWQDVQAHGAELGQALRWRVEAEQELRLDCEPRLLRQCLLNLVHNAMVAMQGQGELSCRAFLDVAGPATLERVVFEVHDSGPGFPAEMLGDRVQVLLSRHAGGTGLGLALAKSIAQRHRGEIELSNPEGGGARVRIAIPQVAVRAH